MANIASQIKRNRQNEKRRLRNRMARSEIRTRVKAAREAIGTDSEADAVREALRGIDKAAAKGILHKNTAARQKSRLMAHVNSGKS